MLITQPKVKNSDTITVTALTELTNILLLKQSTIYS